MSVMKRFLYLSFFVPLLILYAQPTTAAPKAMFSYGTFYSPGIGTYIETYLNFDASSLNFVKTESDEYQATVEILLVFKQDSVIREFRKYELKSPAIQDTMENRFSFTDQQRFLLPDGDYSLEIYLKDANLEESKLTYFEDISISFEPEQINFSTIQLAERIEKADTPGLLTKSGYDIYPYVDYFYPSNINIITYYAEIYDAANVLGQDENVLITCSIEAFETKTIVQNFNRFKRDVAKQVNIVLNSFDIVELPSGNYFLVISMKDRNNNTLASNRVFFQRSNPELKLNSESFEHVSITNTFATQIVNIDSLSYFIQALDPISNYTERELANNLVSGRNLELMQRYFYNFWLQRDYLNPQEAWKNYYIEMCRADANFKTLRKRGYDSDRGRVYLQYGPPNSITQNYNEPHSYPYEIWHYYEINGQRNKRFVFYSQDIVTNNFELIHSDVIGELANPRWNLFLNNRSSRGWDVDTENAPEYWGGKSRDYFDRPR